MNVWNRIPEWMIVAPAVVVWIAAVVDVVRDRSVGPDTRLVWVVFLVLFAPLAPLRFLLRRKVADPVPTEIDPPREVYIDRIEALRAD